MKLTGKTLRRSMSVVLAVMMLASLCAISFGTTASAAETGFTKTYDFTKLSDYYTVGGGTDHFTMAYSGNSDGNSTSPSTWDLSSGFTAYGALIGAGAPAMNYNGMSVSNARLVLQGPADANTNTNGSIVLEEGWTYTVTIKYAVVSSYGYYDSPAISIGMKDPDSNSARTFASATVATEGDLGGMCFNVAKNTYAPNILTAQKKSGLTDFTTVSADFGTWVENNHWKTYTGTYTATSDDAGNLLCVTVGTNGKKTSSGATTKLSDASTWFFSQQMINNVTVEAVAPAAAEKATFAEGAASSTVDITDGKVTMPAMADASYKYWTTADGGIYFPGDVVDAADGDTFTAQAVSSVSDAMASVTAEGEMGDNGTLALGNGLRFKGTLPNSVVDAASEINFKVVPVVAANKDTEAADWFKGGEHTLTVNVPAGAYYADEADGKSYQVCLFGLTEAQLDAEFMVALEVVGADATEYYYIGCTSYSAIAAQ